nr:uncharacterized protein LOC118683045 [Bactrocera oleae]
MDTEMHSTPTPTMRSAITVPRLGIMPTAAPRTPAATAPSSTARNSIRASAAVPSPPEAPHRIRCPLCCPPVAALWALQGHVADTTLAGCPGAWALQQLSGTYTHDAGMRLRCFVPNVWQAASHVASPYSEARGQLAACPTDPRCKPTAASQSCGTSPKSGTPIGVPSMASAQRSTD